tara:strand:- start:425 stop:763 length:339 start_codon:yes stop_codon:yes gene_type:complete
LEEDIICSQLEISAGVLSQAAQNLSVPETTLRRKANKIREAYGNTNVSRLKGWVDMPVLIDGLMRLANDRNASILDLAQHILVREFERRRLPRQEAASLLGVSLPTYRRYLS